MRQPGAVPTLTGASPFRLADSGGGNTADCFVGSGLAFNVAHAQEATKRTDLQRHDLSILGREVIQVRVEIAPELTASRHAHPGEEIIYHRRRTGV